MRKQNAPADVAAIRRAIAEFLGSFHDGRIIGNVKHGVYAFYDYDGEPIYIGQTQESLRVRIRRHLTNQRTDAVAMNVLDPFEVADIEIWPLDEVSTLKERDAKERLNSAEYALYLKVIRESKVGAVLNEKDIIPTTPYELPQSYRARIIPDPLYEARKHADVRIARRASTIAALARVISEREVTPGLRRTLVTQTQRLERLAKERLNEIGGPFPIELPGEETGEDVEDYGSSVDFDED